MLGLRTGLSGQDNRGSLPCSNENRKVGYSMSLWSKKGLRFVVFYNHLVISACSTQCFL